jgi:diaminopimelate decarboxylase
VGTVKEVPGVRVYASVDGGMSDNLRPALYGARYTVVAAGPGSTTAALRPVTVAGKHCETGDILVRDAPLPADLAEGGLLAVAATGAYGHAMASNYNRLPRPAMVLVDGGRVAELVHRETLDHVVARDVVLNDEQI